MPKVFLSVTLFAFLLPILADATAVADSERDWQIETLQAKKALAAGDYKIATLHFQQAARVAQDFGDASTRLENSLTDLGSSLQILGKIEESEAALNRALHIREILFPADSFEVAFGKNNLGAIYQQMGALQKAEILQKQALATAQRLLSPDDVRLIPFLTHNGTLQRALNNFTAAIALEKRALDIADQSNIPDISKVAVLSYLAASYGSAELYSLAEATANRALALAEKVYGANHPQLIPILAKVGALLEAQKQFRPALPFFARALAVCDEAHLVTRPCLVARHDKGSSELALGELGSAEADLENAWDGLNKTYGPLDRDTAVAINDLGQVRLALGHHKEAENSFEDARHVWRVTKGLASMEYAASTGNRAALYAWRGKFARAEQLDREALAIETATLGSSHSRVAETLSRLAVDLAGQKRFDEAEPLLRRSIEIYSSRLGEQSPALAKPLLGLALVLAELNRKEEAVDVYHRGFQVAITAGLNSTGWMATMLDRYSLLMKDRKEYAVAEQAATDALGIRVRKTLHPDGAAVTGN